MTKTEANEPIPTVKTYSRSRLRNLAISSSLTLIILAALAGYGRFRFGSFSAALDFARGEAILVDERAKMISGVHPGNQIVATYSLTNNSGRPLKLIGVVPSCTCTTVESLPLTLAPSETKTITARIKFSEAAPNFSGSMRLFTDEPSSPEIVLSYTLHAAQDMD